MQPDSKIEEIRQKLLANASDVAKKHSTQIRLDDPFLSILSRIVASTAAEIHADQTRLYEKLLDDFIVGFGLRPRLARPAQVPIQFTAPSSVSLVVPADTTISARTENLGTITFQTDAPVRVSSAQIAFAMVYQEHRLRLLPQRLTSSIANTSDFGPFGASCDVDWGLEPALLLAFDNLPHESLSQLGLFVQTDKRDVLKSLKHAYFRLASSRQDFPPEGILRSSAGRLGVRTLEWFMGVQGSSQTDGYLASQGADLPLPEGHFNGQLFLFPSRPPVAKFLCPCPAGLEKAIRSRQFQEYTQHILAPRMWVRLGLPGVESDLSQSFERFGVNVMTASNLYLFDECINLPIDGQSIPLLDRTNSQRYAVAPQAIISSRGKTYKRAFASDSTDEDGSYVVRNCRLDLKPPILPDGTADSKATVALLVTDGCRANDLDTSGFRGSVTLTNGATLRTDALSAPTGGNDGEDLSTARRRFASAILSRGRIITEADLRVAVASFDQTMKVASIRTALERHNGYLRRSHHVQVHLTGEFRGSDEELEQLGLELEAGLQFAAPLDLVIRIELLHSAVAATNQQSGDTN